MCPVEQSAGAPTRGWEVTGTGADLNPEDLEIQVTSTDGEVVVSVRGEIDMATAPSLWKELTELIPDVQKRLVIDLADTRFIDSTGMGVFVKAFERLQHDGAELVLKSPNNSARKVLNLTGLDKVLIVES
jgi:anti-sigma B factor antagonist